MSFDANRDIKIEAAQAADETYSLRTNGLATRKRPELEILGVPEPLIRAAGAVLNKAAEYTVNRAEVLAQQNVGFELAVDENDASLLLAVRTEVSVAPAAGGFFSKLVGGGNKGVLRLVDIDAEPGSEAAPLTALGTMHVHRAAVRRVQKDDDGAREELLAAVQAFPGKIASEAGPPPDIAFGEAVYNWQNHRAWLALAELDDSAEHYGEALKRSHALARAELGATLDEIAQIDAATVRAVAERVVAENLAVASEIAPGPTPTNAVVTSPVWEVSADGSKTFRRASIVPAGFRELYFEGAAAEGLREHGARLATDALVAVRATPWAAAWRFRGLREIWIHRDAPTLPVGEPLPAVGLVSTLLVAVARAFRAGVPTDEIGAYLAGETERFEKALLDLDAWEHEQIMLAIGGAPTD